MGDQRNHSKSVTKVAGLAVAVMLYVFIHEGSHVLVAGAYGEYDALHMTPIGPRVEFKTPVEERSDIRWLFISGSSNLVTLLLGYTLLWYRQELARSSSILLRSIACRTAVVFLLFDAFNLSVGPFLYGGDIGGIAVGLGIHRSIIQALFFLVLVLNRELVAQALLPAYGISTRDPLFRPWFKTYRRRG